MPTHDEERLTRSRLTAPVSSEIWTEGIFIGAVNERAADVWAATCGFQCSVVIYDKTLQKAANILTQHVKNVHEPKRLEKWINFG